MFLKLLPRDRRRLRRRQFRLPFVSREEFNRVLAQRNAAEERYTLERQSRNRSMREIDEVVERLAKVQLYPPVYDDDQIWTVQISLNIRNILPALDRGNDSVIEYISQSMARQLGQKLREMNNRELNKTYRRPISS